MATVITNLLSAIPVFGHDLVELIWIKLRYYIQNIISLINFIFVKNFKFITSIITPSNQLPIIGKINWSKVRNVTPIDDSEKLRLLSIPQSFLGRLVGIIDGDGYISIVKSDKNRGYCTVTLKIGLLDRDLTMLNMIKEVLKIGRIEGPYGTDKKTYYLVFNKTDLQQVLFPLLIFHNISFLTETRREQYKRAIYVMTENILKIEDIPDIILKTELLPPLPATPLEYLSIPYFKAWVVGFTISEGSFFIKSNLDACFEIRQRIHSNLFEAFKLLFNSSRKIGIEKMKYAKFSVSSKKDIQSVINFFSLDPNLFLLGYKLEQYNNWIAKLKLSTRYRNLKF